MKKFVISLDKTPERFENFLQVNSKLKDVNRHTARDGKVESRNLLSVHGYMAPDLDYTDGAIGCAMSHIDLWQQCLRDEESMTIMEDDAIAHHKFDDLSEKLITQLPKDWDIVVWGWNFDCPLLLNLLSGVSSCHISFDQESLKNSWKKYQDLEFKPVPQPLQYCFGTPGYSLSPTGALKLLKILIPIRNFTMHLCMGDAKNIGIDVAMNQAYGRMKAFASFAPLVIAQNIKELSTVSAKPAAKIAA